MNYQRFFLLVLLAPGFIGGQIAFAQGLVVYKHVDPSGRTTYSNQPIKGAVVVELSPLTIMPKSQSAVVAPQVQPRPPDVSPKSVAASEDTGQQSPEPRTGAAVPGQVVTDKPRTSFHTATSSLASQSINLAPATIPGEQRRAVPQPITGTNTVSTVAQRREEVRRRIIQAEIEAEAQLLLEAQDNLQREQSKSAAMRTLRAAIVLDERASAGKQPLGDDIVATKMVVERHFERVRELQDKVLSHEETIAELRVQLREAPQRAAFKSTASLQPASIVTTAQLGTVQGH